MRRNKIIRSMISSGLLLFLFFGCRFISMEQAEYTSYPNTRNQKISGGERVWIEFSVPPDKDRTEQLFTVSRNGTPVSGDYSWENNRLFFTPVPALKPGIRYLLGFDGAFVSENGENHPLRTAVPFFVRTDGPAPVLLHSFPAAEEECGTETELEFQFSKPLDETTFSRGFRVIPECKISTAWNAENSAVTVSAQNGWGPHTVYTWKFAKTVTGKNGVPLGDAYAGTFVTQADTTPPSVQSVRPAAYLAGTFLDQPSFGRDDLIKLVFSEEVVLQSLRDAFSLSPPLSGRFGKAGDREIIFFPEAPFTMNTEYTVTIDTRLHDGAGNYPAEPFHYSFIPDIPEQQVESVRFLEIAPVVELDRDRFRSQEFPVVELAGAEPDLSQTVEVLFSRPYGEPYRSRLTRAITCTGYFPAAVSDPALELASWDGSDTRLLLKYSGFEKSPAGTGTSLYKLTIPGGKSLTENQDGSFIPEEIWIIFKTAPEGE